MQQRRLARRTVPKGHRERAGRAAPGRGAVESWLVQQPGCPARTGPGFGRPGHKGASSGTRATPAASSSGRLGRLRHTAQRESGGPHRRLRRAAR
jgi:hypothetical protein